MMAIRSLPGRGFESTSVIDRGWKLIRNHPAPEGVNEYELYDHRADPLNQRDLATEQPERVAQAQPDSVRMYLSFGNFS